MAQVDQITVLIKGEDALSRPTAAAARSLQSLDAAAHGANSAVAAVGETAQKQTGALGGFASALSKIGLAGLGIQAAVAGIKSVAGVFTGPIQAASDLNETMNKVDVVFGDSAKGIQDWARTAAQGMGQSREQALEAAGGFGNLFVSMGLGQKPAADLSKRIVELGSDLASFNNIDPAEALDKLRSGLVGESEPLRSLGVNLNEAAVQDEALRLGLGKSADTLTEAAKVQARYSLILKQTGTAQGDFKRTSDGMANSQRIIAASFADLRTEIGNRFLPVIAPLVAGFARLLPAAMDRLMPALDRAGTLFRDAASGLGMVVRMVQTRGFLETLRELGQRAIPVLLAGFQSVRDLAGRIAGWLRAQIAQINWTAVWSAARNVAAGLVAGLGSIVSGVTSWLVAQWRAIDWAAVWRSVTGVASGLVGALGSVVSAVTTWLGQQWAAIRWAEVWPSVTNAATGLAAGLGSITSAVVSWLGDQWALIKWDAIWTRATDVGKGLVDGLAEIADSVTTWVGAQWALIDWPAVWKEAKGHGTALVAALAPIGRDLTTWMADQWRAIDWDAVMSRARVGAEASAAVVRSFEAMSVIPIAEAIGTWFGTGVRAALDKVLQAGPGGAFGTAPADLLAALRTVFLEVAPQLPGMFARVIVDALWAGWTAAIRAFLGRDPGALLRAAVQSATAGIVPGGGGTPAADVKPGAPTEGPTGPIGAYQHGGSFYVGGSGGPDSQMVAFRASPGERVDVTPPGRRGGGWGDLHVNAPLIHVERMEGNVAALEPMLDRVRAFLVEDIRVARGQGVPAPAGITPRGSR